MRCSGIGFRTDASQQPSSPAPDFPGFIAQELYDFWDGWNDKSIHVIRFCAHNIRQISHRSEFLLLINTS